MDFERELAGRADLLNAIAGGEPGDRPLAPLTAKVKLLWSCNLACRFCSLPEPGDRIERDDALRLGRDLHGLGLRKVHFSGGEIFLHPDIHAILGDWSSLGIQVNLTTNGTLLGKDDVRKLEGAGVHAVTISLDSALPELHDKLRRMKGAHRLALGAARRIAARGKIRLAINTVVTAANIGGMGELRELVRELGPGVRWKLIPVDAERKRLRPVQEEVARLAAEAAQWPELEDRYPFGGSPAAHAASCRGRHGLHRGRCHAPWFHLFVAPDGRCYPCCMSRGTVPPYGNILREGVAPLLSSPLLAAVRRGAAGVSPAAVQPHESSHLFPVCARCDDFLGENRSVERLLARRLP
jgi:MoaA/NifB/PqqE/SkfB family radical SAM enzyme